ncbi:dihydropteroate synthase [Streptomyces krungchingensis]
MCQYRSTRSCLSSSASPSLVGAPYLNDIQGFPDPGSYEELTGSGCRLNVRHSVQRRAPATEALTDATEVGREIEEFFAGRLAAPATAGISREQLVIDPGRPSGPFRNQLGSVRQLWRRSCTRHGTERITPVPMTRAPPTMRSPSSTPGKPPKEEHDGSARSDRRGGATQRASARHPAGSAGQAVRILGAPQRQTRTR